MKRGGYLIHLLGCLAFVVGVRIAMMMWSDWLAGLMLLPLPFYLFHDYLLWRLRRRRGPLYSACRLLRLTAWQRGRRMADELDALPHKPHGFCPKCSYPMNIGRCPECGHVVTLKNIRAEPSGFLRRHRWKLIATIAVVLFMVGAQLIFTRAPWLSYLSLESVTRLDSWGYEAAGYELESRFSSNKLKPHELMALFKRTLVGEFSIPSPYPRDVVVPCDFRFRKNVSTMNSSIYCDIQTWTLELDGAPIRTADAPDKRVSVQNGLFFRLPITSPGEHVVHIFGELILYDLNSLRTSTQPDAYAIPFSAEQSFVVYDRPAAEMIQASQQLVAEDQSGLEPVLAYVRHADFFDDATREHVRRDDLIISTNRRCPPACTIAAIVHARPKGGVNFTRLGGCYLDGTESAWFRIDRFPELVQADELEVRLDPDAREAAYGSRMKCRRYYGQTLILSAKKREWSR